MKKSIKRKLHKQIKKTRIYKKIRRVMIARFILKASRKLLVVGVIASMSASALYMFNGESEPISYVLRPLLNKRCDAQVRDRKT